MAKNYDTTLMPEAWTDVEAPRARYVEEAEDEG